MGEPGEVLIQACPACGSSDLDVFTEPTDLPTQSCTLWPGRDAALDCPRGTMSLALCGTCGLLVNVAFDPSLLDYDENYENSLHFSSLFQSYARELGTELIERYNLHKKVILEIGCGKGDFLRMMVELGDNTGIGVDPSFEEDPTRPIDDRLVFVKGYYLEADLHVSPDLVIARQLLEHVDDPRSFLAHIREILGDRSDSVVVFEVPNALDMLQRADVWDVIYEHPVYYTPQALKRLLTSAGFTVHDVRAVYENLYLVIEASPSVGERGEQPRVGYLLEEDVHRFAAAYEARIDEWRAKLAEIIETGLRAVLWGAGARGDAFLNALQIRDEIPLVIDINPRKWGRHMAGTGQPIHSPDVLMEQPPDVVVIANEIYKGEIADDLEKMGIDAEILIA